MWLGQSFVHGKPPSALRMHLDHEPLGRDAFHRVRNLRRKKTDAVERVPTGFMGSFHDFKIAHRGRESAGTVGRVSPLRAVCPLPSRGAHGVTRPAMRNVK